MGLAIYDPFERFDATKDALPVSHRADLEALLEQALSLTRSDDLQEIKALYGIADFVLDSDIFESPRSLDRLVRLIEVTETWQDESDFEMIENELALPSTVDALLHGLPILAARRGEQPPVAFCSRCFGAMAIACLGLAKLDEDYYKRFKPTDKSEEEANQAIKHWAGLSRDFARTGNALAAASNLMAAPFRDDRHARALEARYRDRNALKADFIEFWNGLGGRLSQAEACKRFLKGLSEERLRLIAPMRDPCRMLIEALRAHRPRK